MKSLTNNTMKTTEKSIHQIIKALMELEAKGCHTVFYEYGNGLLKVRIFKGKVKAENIVFEKTTNTADEQTQLDEITNHVTNMSLLVMNTPFQCYRQEFIKGVKAGKWEKINPPFVVGENATQAMTITSSGYFIDDPDNSLRYFVDYERDKQASK
jgi:hypothetical protein